MATEHNPDQSPRGLNEEKIDAAKPEQKSLMRKNFQTVGWVGFWMAASPFCVVLLATYNRISIPRDVEPLFDILNLVGVTLAVVFFALGRKAILARLVLLLCAIDLFGITFMQARADLGEKYSGTDRFIHGRAYTGLDLVFSANFTHDQKLGDNTFSFPMALSVVLAASGALLLKSKPLASKLCCTGAFLAAVMAWSMPPKPVHDQGSRKDEFLVNHSAFRFYSAELFGAALVAWLGLASSSSMRTEKEP